MGRDAPSSARGTTVGCQTSLRWFTKHPLDLYKPIAGGLKGHTLGCEVLRGRRGRVEMWSRHGGSCDERPWAPPSLQEDVTILTLTCLPIQTFQAKTGDSAGNVGPRGAPPCWLWKIRCERQGAARSSCRRQRHEPILQ